VGSVVVLFLLVWISDEVRNAKMCRLPSIRSALLERFRLKVIDIDSNQSNSGSQRQVKLAREKANFRHRRCHCPRIGSVNSVFKSEMVTAPGDVFDWASCHSWFHPGAVGDSASRLVQ
jgi:hypothetical protein